jgi:hypothetical protein
MRFMALFQSTHPRGVRRLTKRILPNDNEVSIHAPAGGATILHLISIIETGSFNPRTRGGCDQNNHYQPDQYTAFQSTHPRGVRLSGRHRPIILSRVSIHAPAGGATMPCSLRWANSGVSIHAPAGGATAPSIDGPSVVLVSIHAPAGGATVKAMDTDSTYVTVSIHAPAGGATS